MNDASKLAAAIQEAERFLYRAKLIQDASPRTYGTTTVYKAGPKETGAARRASLDLTRALAELRRPS